MEFSKIREKKDKVIAEYLFQVSKHTNKIIENKLTKYCLSGQRFLKIPLWAWSIRRKIKKEYGTNGIDLSQLTKQEIKEYFTKALNLIISELEESGISASVGKDWLGRYILTIKVPQEPIKL